METKIFPVVVAEGPDGQENVVLRRLDPTVAPADVDLETEATRQRNAAFMNGQYPPTNIRIETRTAEELGLS